MTNQERFSVLSATKESLEEVSQYASELSKKTNLLDVVARLRVEIHNITDPGRVHGKVYAFDRTEGDEVAGTALWVDGYSMEIGSEDSYYRRPSKDMIFAGFTSDGHGNWYYGVKAERVERYRLQWVLPGVEVGETAIAMTKNQGLEIPVFALDLSQLNNQNFVEGRKTRLNNSADQAINEVSSWVLY